MIKRNLNKKELFVLLFSFLTLIIQAQNFDIQGFATLNGGTTGGEGGTTVTVSTADDLEDYCGRDGSYIIYIDGTISYTGMINITSDKSILGVSGTSGKISGGGLSIDNESNIIIQNLTITGSSDDAINVEDYSTNIWIDHCDFSNCSDGLVDIRMGSNYCTVSWCKFSDHDKVALIGSSDDNDYNVGLLKVTYHHNWFCETTQRHPRCRFGEVHVYNNYYDNIGSYGVASTTEALVYVENNYFLNTDRPTSIQEGTSPEGYLEFVNNTLDNSGDAETNGTTFDPEDYYDYSLESRSTCNESCISYAGVGIIDPGTGGSNDDDDDDYYTIDGTYAIIASHSGKALDVYEWGTTDGTNICQWDYWEGECQQFIIEPVDDEWHRITPVIATDQALDVYDVSTDNGANINTWEYWGGYGQQFKFQSAGTGLWRIINRNSDKCFDVEDASTEDGANVQQWTCTSGSEWQMFELVNLKSTSEPLAEITEVNVYPNPANEYLNIALPDGLREGVLLKVINNLGQVVINETYISGDVSELNVGTLSEGMYILQLQKGEDVINKLFNKE